MATSNLDIPLAEITMDNFEHLWTRFTLVAAAKEWPEAKQLIVLPTLLRGKLLDYFIELVDDEKRDVGTLKASLIGRVGLKKNVKTAAVDF